MNGISPQHVERAEWLLLAIEDGLLANELQLSNLTTRNLSGKGLQQGKGTIDLLLFKLQVKQWFLTTWLDSAPLEHAERNKLREVFQSHKSFRQHFGNNEGDADLTWLGALSPPGRLVADMLESIVFTSREDSKVKRLVQGGTTIQARSFPKSYSC